MRSLRHELLSATIVLSVPAAIALALPTDAFRFRARPVPAESSASVAFVTLAPDEEARALVAAKTAWQNGAPAGQRMRIRLPLGELPEEKEGPLLDIGAGVRPPAVPRPVGYAPAGWAPSLRAGAPDGFAPGPERRSAPAFSREEMLKLN